ncbi:MAG: hypothetical protein ACRCZI_12995, partial [Cetobacterium sp.]
LPLEKQRWLMKHLTGQCGVGHTLMKKKYQDHDNCPLCNKPDETTAHVILCRDRRARTKLTILLQAFAEWMTETNTLPSLQQAILQRLHEWRHRQTPKIVKGSRALRKAVKEQDAIGWENFFNGRPSKLFTELQHKHYQEIGLQFHGHSWLSKTISQLYDISWGMWEHRNEIKHNTTTPKQKELLTQLWLQVEHQFLLGTLGLPATDHYLLEVKEDIFTYDLPRTQRWLGLITGAREEQIQVEATLKNQFARARNFMRQWLMKANPPNRIKI